MKHEKEESVKDLKRTIRVCLSSVGKLMLHVVYYLLSGVTFQLGFSYLLCVDCWSLLFVFASTYDYDSPCLTFSLLFFFPLLLMFRRKRP